MEGRLLSLPGEGSVRSFALSRALLAGLLGLLWLPCEATLVPALGLDWLALDPILPLIAAFALGGRRLEAWSLALVLGYLADFYTGAGSGRLLLQYSLVVCMATPLHGRIVLRARSVPVIGVCALSLASNLGVLFVLGAVGANRSSDLSSLPMECLGAGLVTLLLWPVFRRIGGWRDDRRMALGASK
ncbi:MAG: hypothetical protein VX498_16125 [Myxococcota bacterium]|nr:hypothetical protein [Myxococcota bacterium]